MFVKDLTRYPEIENTPVWVLSIIWRLGQVGVTKFGMNVSNQKFLMLKNAKFTTFIISELSPTHALRLELMFTFMTFLQWKRWSKNEMVRLHWTDDTILSYFLTVWCKAQMLVYEFINVMRYTIWYHLYNIKNIKNTHGGVVLSVSKVAGFSL